MKRLNIERSLPLFSSLHGNGIEVDDKHLRGGSVEIALVKVKGTLELEKLKGLNVSSRRLAGGDQSLPWYLHDSHIEREAQKRCFQEKKAHRNSPIVSSPRSPSPTFLTPCYRIGQSTLPDHNGLSVVVDGAVSNDFDVPITGQAGGAADRDTGRLAGDHTILQRTAASERLAGEVGRPQHARSTELLLPFHHRFPEMFLVKVIESPDRSMIFQVPQDKRSYIIGFLPDIRSAYARIIVHQMQKESIK
ncbi:hypothetical protein SAY87_007097 [Trapa incisa]|uniref:Uncharacterized protein n=1 Tax=Trapa incisa TaxID=236973 RepID=A0AAN7K3J9_9MYRT|nr:hypothetical protein SAY87_007097 [Trapa incisa]